MQSRCFFEKGWLKLNRDPLITHWVDTTLIPAKKLIAKKANRHWLRCGGTWFAGVNVLGNDASGSVEGGPVLAGNAIEFIRKQINPTQLTWDQGQLSVCYPGYPKPMQNESPAAYNYRLNHDAAHLDGLLPEGINRRRHLREYHGFILGIPMVECSPRASPLVVWEGSHEIIRRAFKTEFSDMPPSHWGDVDITELYQDTRREIFKHCPRVEVFARPGETYIIHRLCLHGVAPWTARNGSSEDGRMICYFRPETSGPRGWLYDR